MSTIESLVGHLLSQYTETVLEGVKKIQNRCGEKLFADTFIENQSAIEILCSMVTKERISINDGFEVLSALLRSSSKKNQVCLARVICDKLFKLIVKTVKVLNDSSLSSSCAAICLVSELFKAAPRLIFAKLDKVPPITWEVFRNQVPFGLRRIRLPRTKFLLELISSPFSDLTEKVFCTHGFLSQLMEDVVELFLTESSGAEVVKSILSKFETEFIQSGQISMAMKRSLLLAQKNVLRVLVKGLGVSDLTKPCAGILHCMIVELRESARDYAIQKTEEDDPGMSNFLLFCLLRYLHPKSRVVDAQLCVQILQSSSDLIRPFFSRYSHHLLQEEKSLSRVAGICAISDLLTRVALCPIPQHLRVGVGSIVMQEESARTFFDLTPTTLRDEVCPSWIAEFIHKIVNSSTNTMLLAWALQCTHAMVRRAIRVKATLSVLLRNKTSQDGTFDEMRADYFMSSFETLVAEALPKREEIFHRLTQQVHSMMGNPHDRQRGHFIFQRICQTFAEYTEFLNLRSSWLGVIPTAKLLSVKTITEALNSNEHLTNFPAASMVVLCHLLFMTMLRGTQISKIHHISFGTAFGKVTDWPTLLSILRWRCINKDKQDAESKVAVIWISKLVIGLFRSVSRFSVSLCEMEMLLDCFEERTLAMLLHFMNWLQQQSLSKKGESGASLLESISAFCTRQKEKCDTKDESKKKDLWTLDVEANIVPFTEAVKLLHATFDRPATKVLLQTVGTSNAYFQKRETRMSAIEGSIMRKSIVEVEELNTIVIKVLNESLFPRLNPCSHESVTSSVTASSFRKHVLGSIEWMSCPSCVWAVLSHLRVSLKDATAVRNDFLRMIEPAQFHECYKTGTDFHKLGLLLLVFSCIYDPSLNVDLGVLSTIETLVITCYCGTMSATCRVAYAIASACDRKTQGSKRQRSPGFFMPPFFRRCRYLVNGSEPISGHCAEVEALQAFVESWSKEDVENQALTMNLSLSLTPKDELHAIFPELGRSALASSRSIDPRYIVPLVATVGAISRSNGTAVPTQLLSKAYLCCVRALSLTDMTLRTTACLALSLISSALSPLQKAIVNNARLRLLRQSKERNPRLGTGFSSFLVLCASLVLVRPTHVLHRDAVRVLHDEKGMKNPCPLQWVLSAFPTSCITSSLMAAKQEELKRNASKSMSGMKSESYLLTKIFCPPHLRYIMKQLKYSCVTVSDARCLVRSGALGNLMILCASVSSAAHLQLELVETIHDICLGTPSVSHFMAVEGNVMMWCLSFTQQLALCDAARNEIIVSVLKLILKLLPHYRVTKHQREQVHNHACVLLNSPLQQSVFRVEAIDILARIKEDSCQLA